MQLILGVTDKYGYTELKAFVLYVLSFCHISLASIVKDISKQCKAISDGASDQVLHYLLEENTFKCE